MRLITSFLPIIFFANIAVAGSELAANCQLFVNSLPDGYKWGFLQVPERAGDASSKVSMFYYHSPQALSSKSPIVFVNGGPAASSHESAQALLAGEKTKDLPWIFFDQRGTGCSSSFPEIEDGLEKLEAWGAYNIAKDMEALKNHLIGKNKKWQVFGHSYGGLVTYWYLTQFPVSVSTAHIYGYAFNDDPIDWVKQKLIYSKVLQDQFFGNDTDKTDVLKEFTDLISSDECVYFSDKKICGKGLVDQMGLYLLFPSHWPVFDGYLKRMRSFLDEGMGKKEDILVDLGRISFRVLAQPVADHQSFLSNLDIVPGLTPQKAYIQAYQQVKAEGYDIDNWLINDYRGLMALEDPAPPLVPAKITHQLEMASLKAAIEKNKEAKIYVYAGGRDGLAPPSTFSELRSKIGSRILYHEIPEADHNGAFSEGLVFENLISN